ncbi:atpase : ATPase AAA OS=Cystobacter violaceus Cb vi76 GN=Q664_20165 PE=4 SV=1: AAA_5 [Gemmataceae bacterium]|nr:atpase : ATPase AAA OS=Cystobacter violaceus Cb vi76 GN=Q664_20165 PE=4 SV=1: AAA_5 [Gemmataceae bacterium]VTU02395.1 atpase : ATPase AAA OS=Cystobacter violaceus Cb vi76 GN=Q664_20165 PE=4 SV=1: AAA_5 [Gemmataceae bacterium]
MAKKPAPAAPQPTTADVLREPAEVRYADQLEALRQNDADAPPANWRLSPRSVLLYVVGGKTLKATIGGKPTEVPITRKFFGDDGIVERAIVTLASERALLLVGEPGCGKSWLSEHLAAAVCGTSLLTIQGTAGTTEEHIKYSWNIARVIAEGPTPQNMIPSPTMVAMRAGGLLRFEELTRCVPDVQDSLVSILSDKAVAVPELPNDNMVFAKPGFNVIATANTRDQGVNELSAALKRRFNYVYIPIIGDQKTEVKLVQQRSAELLERYNLPAKLSPSVIELLATVFREIRNGKSTDGVSLKKPSTPMSTAEAIGVALDAALHSRFFGAGEVGPADIARNMVGAVVKEDQEDKVALKEYATLVAKKRAAKDKSWKDFHEALVEQL